MRLRVEAIPATHHPPHVMTTSALPSYLADGEAKLCLVPVEDLVPLLFLESALDLLDEMLDAACKVADAGFGVAFHFDPIVLSNDIEADVVEYMEVIDRIFDRICANSIAWVSLGLLRFPPSLPAKALKFFPDTRIFAGELIPAGRKFRYPRFMRKDIYRPLWERLASKLPAHKLYLCMETPQAWKGIDPAISTSSCIEKRLCNLEFLKDRQ